MAATGREAVEKAATCKPNLVMMDIYLEAEMDGVEAAAQIRAQSAIPVIYLTAYADAATIERASLTQPYSYLLKPVNMKELQAVITIALHKHDMEQRLERQVRALQGRERLMQLQMALSEDLGQVYNEIVQIVGQVVGVEHVTLCRPDETGAFMEPKATMGLSAPGQLANEQQLSRVATIRVSDEDSLIAQAFRQCQPKTGAGGEAAVPLIHNEETLGVLQVRGLKAVGEDGEALLNMLWSLGGDIALILRTMQLVEDLEEGRFEVEELLNMEE